MQPLFPKKKLGLDFKIASDMLSQYSKALILSSYFNCSLKLFFALIYCNSVLKLCFWLLLLITSWTSIKKLETKYSKWIWTRIHNESLRVQLNSSFNNITKAIFNEETSCVNEFMMALLYAMFLATQFSTWNRSLDASDFFPMFKQWINCYIFHCHILKRKDV